MDVEKDNFCCDGWHIEASWIIAIFEACMEQKIWFFSV